MGKSPSATAAIALVDIGSNAARCVLARLDAGPGFEIGFGERVQTQLGHSPSDGLPPAAEPMTVQHRTRARGVKAERADVLVVGGIVLEELLASSRYPALTVSRTRAREGVLWRRAEDLVRRPLQSCSGSSSSSSA